jgi:hypothetical protein
MKLLAHTPLRYKVQFLTIDHTNNTLDSAFHTINIVWRKSVMELLFVQQQKDPPEEQVIMG